MNKDIYIEDLDNVLFKIRVHYGWRAVVASYLIRLGAWVGGSTVEFIGEDTP